MCERDAGIQPSNTFDVWYHWDRDGYMLQTPISAQDAASNMQLDVMWRRVIHVWNGARLLDRLIRVFDGNDSKFIVPFGSQMDERGMQARYPAHLSFTDAEMEIGLAELSKMGIGPEDKFVCFHARDSAYLDIARPVDVELYGDWRWQDHRDSSIENFLPAMDQLTNLGYFAVRMGKHVNKAIDSPNPMIIDYATQFQSDFMDVFLSAHCTFFVGQGSGMIRLPMIFRKPVAYTNMSDLWDIQDGQYDTAITILKKVYSVKRSRFLTFRELLDLGLARFSIKIPEHKKMLDDLELKFVENTPEEISDLTMEMHQWLNSETSITDGETERHGRFLALLEAYPDDITIWEEAPAPKFGRQFLKENQELLV